MIATPALPINRPTTARRKLVARMAALLLLLVAIESSAQGWASDPVGPKLARGLSTPFGTFDTQDIDSINLYNGSLNLAIPIGQRYPAGGALSYQLVAHYNSNDTDVRSNILDAGKETAYEFSYHVPNTLSNAGRGWSVHLGRLLVCCPGTASDPALPFAQLERLPTVETEWTYISSDGATHLLEATLHGEAPIQPLGSVHYSRDGTYLRLREVSAAMVEVDFPDGQIHRFERRAWLDAQYNLDRWRLTEIRDRSGNRISVTYFADHWQVADAWRTQKIYWESDPWYAGRVKQVELAAFNGTIARYAFVYAQAEFPHLVEDSPQPNPGSHLEIARVGVLTSITRPDNAAYSFTDLRTQSVSPSLIASLPSGGSITWEFKSFEMPSDYACAPGGGTNGPANGPLLAAVVQRSVRATGGGILKRTMYLRHVDHSAQIPATFCYSNGQYVRPPAEMVVGELQKYSAGKSRLTLSYFSAFGKLFDNIAPGLLIGPGGWSGQDQGQPFTRDVYDTDTPPGLLSTRTFDCPFDTVSEYNLYYGNPEDVAAPCLKQRSTYVKIEGERDNGTCAPGWRCFLGNPMTSETTTRYHDDGSKFTTEKFSENDGFGHYRTVTMQGNISGRDRREMRTFYNAAKEELRLTAQGQIAPDSAWTNYAVGDPWILQNYSNFRVLDANGNAGYREQRCYTAEGLLRRVRVQAKPSTATGGIDSPNDLLSEHVYSGGEAIKTQFYGGDKQALALLGCNFQPAGPQYTIERAYEYGALKSSRIASSTATLADFRIDASTGAIAESSDAAGVVKTFYTYDALGRLTSARRDHGLADIRYSYYLPAYGAQQAGDISCSGAPGVNVLTAEAAVEFSRAAACYNALGQNTESFVPHPEAERGPMRIVREFTPDDRLARETVAQLATDFNSAFATIFEYDALGRLATMTAPDGSVTTVRSRGIREQKITRRVGTGESGSTVLQSPSETTSTYDRHGNALSVTTDAHATFFIYNALDRVTRAWRGEQSRLYAYDGRGFLLWEQQPEFNSNSQMGTSDGFVLYQGYDAVGNVGAVFDGTHTRDYTYDLEGRLIEVRAGGSALPELANYFGTQGAANGRLTDSIRYNFFNPVNSGGYFTNATDGIRAVAYHYSYEDTGSVDTRHIHIYAPFLQTAGFEVTFTQSWEYDALGRATAASYPSCAGTFIGCIDVPRTVSRIYHAPGSPNSQGVAVRRITGTDDLGARFDYHPNGQLARITHDNGRHDVFGMDASRMSRVGSMNLAAASATPSSAGLLDLGRFEYDDAGNIIKIGNGRYLYDANGRLKKTANPGNPSGGQSRSYSYDQYDNLTQKGETLIPYDPLTNRHADRGVRYDTAGQVAQVGTAFSLFYDSARTLGAVIHNPYQDPRPCKPYYPSQSSSCWMYLYGPDGQRIGIMSSTPPGSGANLDVDWTVRDLDGQILRTFFQSLQGAPTNQLSMPLMRDDYVYSGRGVLSRFDPSTGERRHFHLDHLGTTRLATNASGALIGGQPRHYWPYGDDAGTDTLGERIAEWAGYEEDPNGLTHNLTARTYFKGWGRFLVPDPARAGWNLYAYANNNPINLIDPLGLEAKCMDQGQEANDQEEKGNGVACAEEVTVTDEEPPAGAHSETITVTAMDPCVACGLMQLLTARQTPSIRSVSEAEQMESSLRYAERLAREAEQAHEFDEGAERYREIKEQLHALNEYARALAARGNVRVYEPLVAGTEQQAPRADREFNRWQTRLRALEFRMTTLQQQRQTQVTLRQQRLRPRR